MISQGQVHNLPRSEPQLFVRQPLTQTHGDERQRIQHFMDWLKAKPVQLLLGPAALSEEDFRAEFERRSGSSFTPEHFRQHRLELLREQTDGFVFYWGAGLSVSGGFEVGYLYHHMTATKNNVPLFFALAAPMKTTLLRDLPGAFYASFSQPEELNEAFDGFLREVHQQKLGRSEMRAS